MINPLTAIDFYKADHRSQYPLGTTEVYSNFTPRSLHLAKVIKETFDNKVVFFGLQYFLKHFLLESWDQGFFKKPREVVVAQYKRRMDNSLGKDSVDVQHIGALHDLGYLPIRVKALMEGVKVPIGVPVITIVNTHPDFFWLTNYIESAISCYLWKPMTTATTAFEFNRLLSSYAKKTGTAPEFIKFQAHDFSLRGMSGLEDAALSGAGHLTSFWGTDTVPAIDLVEEYYHANSDLAPVGFSVPATEHSVMSMGTMENELQTFRRLISEIYPNGIVSIVSDTWDFWKVVTNYTATLKAEILARDGKVVIRPDSGDPVKIVCGDPTAPEGSPERRGAIECLWDVFGGTVTTEGYKQLDPHIGLIYGDSITLERAKGILEGLACKGFGSGNVVFGVGSYSYQFVTRDNFGFAMKATSGVVNGERRDIYKSPKTDIGTKKSARGLLRVEREGDKLVLHDNQTLEQERSGELKAVFENGKLLIEHSLEEIRDRVQHELDLLLTCLGRSN